MRPCRSVSTFTKRNPQQSPHTFSPDHSHSYVFNHVIDHQTTRSRRPQITQICSVKDCGLASDEERFSPAFIHLNLTPPRSDAAHIRRREGALQQPLVVSYISRKAFALPECRQKHCVPLLACVELRSSRPSVRAIQFMTASDPFGLTSSLRSLRVLQNQEQSQRQ